MYYRAPPSKSQSNRLPLLFLERMQSLGHVLYTQTPVPMICTPRIRPIYYICRLFRDYLGILYRNILACTVTAITRLGFILLHYTDVL